MDQFYHQRWRDVSIQRVEGSDVRAESDQVATEEPVEFRLVYDRLDGDSSPAKRRSRSIAVTMRTPGDDRALAVGFLLSEGVIQSTDQIESFVCSGPLPEGSETGTTLEIHLQPGIEFDESKLHRNFYVSSSCGVCGKASLESIRAQCLQPMGYEFSVPASVVHQLPTLLREHQSVFRQTGGIHGAGLFDRTGRLIEVKEDVGRHNAVDKVVGAYLLDDQSDPKRPTADILVVSGRASFELVQKSIFARVPILVAVGAPSSLAVELAVAFQSTLIGFTSTQRFNIYSSPQRVALLEC